MSEQALKQIPVDSIRPNPDQPRKRFDEGKLADLADSIREHGVIQPIEVEPNGDGYVLHHGERRWRAARMAGLEEIPAVVAGRLDERDRLLRALVENVQRADMDVIEEAAAYARLRDEFGLSMTAIAREMGRAGATVKNRLDWLTFDEEIQDLVQAGDLHADNRVQEALRRVPAEMRVKFARRVAGQTIRGIQKAAQVLVDGLEKAAPEALSRRPAGRLMDDCEPAPDKGRGFRRAHSLTLTVGECSVPGPSGELVEAAAQAACDACTLFEYKPGPSCRQCPAVTLVRHYVEGVGVTT